MSPDAAPTALVPPSPEADPVRPDQPSPDGPDDLASEQARRIQDLANVLLLSGAFWA
jgi:hypothetical protein